MAETGTGAMEKYLLFIACSVCFLIEPRAINPKLALCTVSWALPYQLTIKKTHYGLAHRPMKLEQFLN